MSCSLPKCDRQNSDRPDHQRLHLRDRVFSPYPAKCWAAPTKGSGDAKPLTPYSQYILPAPGTGRVSFGGALHIGDHVLHRPAASLTSAISWMRTSRSNNTSWRRAAVSSSSFFCNVPSWQWRDANPGRTSYPLRRLSARPPPGPFQVRSWLPLSVRSACARYRRPPGQLRRGATRSAQRCSTARRCESPVASRCVLL